MIVVFTLVKNTQNIHRHFSEAIFFDTFSFSILMNNKSYTDNLVMIKSLEATFPDVPKNKRSQNFGKFTGKHLWWSLTFYKVTWWKFSQNSKEKNCVGGSLVFNKVACWKHSQNLQENTWARVLFLIKLHAFLL